MEVYYIFSENLPKEIKDKISDFFKLKGCTLNFRVKGISSSKINTDDAKEIFIKNIRNIKNAKIIIAECSYHSNGIGLEIALALEEKKTVIAIYNLSIDVNNPRHIDNALPEIRGNTAKNIIVREYNRDNLHFTLEKVYEEATSLFDTKLNLIIPPEIDRYLEWKHKYKYRAKSEVTREALEEKIKNDKEYQDYLKSIEYK